MTSHDHVFKPLFHTRNFILTEHFSHKYFPLTPLKLVQHWTSASWITQDKGNIRKKTFVSPSGTNKQNNNIKNRDNVSNPSFRVKDKVRAETGVRQLVIETGSKLNFNDMCPFFVKRQAANFTHF